MNKVESDLRHFATSRCSQSLQKHFTDAADEIARLEALADVVHKQIAAECAKICEYLEAPHYSLSADIVYLGATIACGFAIKARFGLDAEGAKE